MARPLPLLLVALAPALAGAAGYFGARFLNPAPAPTAAAAAGHAAPKPDATLPVGTFAVQIYQPRRIDTLVAEVSVTVAGPSEATLQTPQGMARLRDRAYQVLLDAAETPDYRGQDITAAQVARTLAAGLGPAAPGLRGVSVQEAVTMKTPRR
ncbi:hypothetical protein U879_09555 [Defluviimonas sp. 20V17]|uniref:Flagellar protein FliL n=1 Tax=Allgaiera indica TaxID=765699 RepID=A0AAN4UNP1_9RHOB|nr:hypothetical protein [Allgaiera indica]KDB03931.1 hypothetical protein U879_09555 [Defluviimonas sp. 20V17]GHD99232.1 hypothetical protein GCM10008024_05790 [Allgaiera indica]SDW30899.1 hypothetical protein SAMN05444006_102296 [Allgaiera indica]